VSRLAVQALILLGISAGLAFSANVLRTDRLALATDPTRYRYQDIRFIAVDDAARIHEADPTVLFLDARDPGAYERRRILGAVSFPADALDPAYAELRDFLIADTRLVVYSEDVLLSVRAARFLAARGYDAAVLDGGWDAWGHARLPVE